LREVIRLAAATVGLLALTVSASAEAATLQPIGGFSSPMYVTSPPDEPERLLVAQRGGRIEQVREGVVTNFADLESVVSCCGGENGLQSIAIAADFASTGRFFVDYTGLDGNIHVAELRAIGTTAPLATLREVLTISHPDGSIHNGGQLQIGPDGLLYISTGDDGDAANAQDPGSLLGKILRIDPRPSGPQQYSIPAGNPIPDSAVWSLGLRNPFRFSFDPAGAMLIADVGADDFEEVDYAPPGSPGGANYGWDCFEGTALGPATAPGCATPPAGGFVPPIFVLPHDDPGGGKPFGCAIIGGYVVRDQSLGDLFGRYVYTDYCGEQVRSFALGAPTATDRSEGLTVIQPTSFGEDSCGRLYVVSREGLVARLTGSNPAACPLLSSAPLARTFVGIRAASRKVIRGKRATITVWVSPCRARKGNRVSLYRGARRIGARRLDTVCSARFRPRISRRSNFRATIAATGTYEAGVSRKLTIRPRKPRRR
jgi:hypothetical protein